MFQSALPVIPSLSFLSRSASLCARSLSSNSAVAPLGWLSAVAFPANAPLQCVASSSGADSEPEVYSCGLKMSMSLLWTHDSTIKFFALSEDAA